MDDYASELLSRHADAFALVREAATVEAEKHARPGDVATYQAARELATLVASARATYVLLAGGDFGYLTLHIAATFGHTGQVDVVEADPVVMAYVEQAARQQSLGDRVRVYLGSAESVLSSLNGPYDAIVLRSAGEGTNGTGPRLDDLVRLTRTGGTIIVAEGRPEGEGGSPLLEAMATDPRLLVSFPADLSPVIAVRRR